MNWQTKLYQFPSSIKKLMITFLSVLVFGYIISFSLLYQTTNLTPHGIEENYNGNEDDEDAEILKFKKSIHEMKSTIHNHLFAMAMMLSAVGFILYFTSINSSFKTFLMIEPLISLIITFGSLLLMWNGFEIFKFITIISGTIMHTSFILSIFISLRELVFIKK